MSTSSIGTVLVTGASSGIGRATTTRLERSGYTVYAGVRQEDDGDSLLKEHPNGRVIPVLLDVTKPDMLEAVRARLTTELEGSGLHGLVNNAGTILVAPLEFSELEEVRDQFEINVLAPLAMSQALLPLLRRAGGHIVNIGSVSGSFSTPFTGGYNASKAALRSMSDALRLELAPWNVHVTIIEPGTVHTPMWPRSLRHVQRLEQELPPTATALYGPVFDRMRDFILNAQGVSADHVAAVIERSLRSERPRAYYTVGSDARFRLLLARLPARLRDFLVGTQLPKYPTADR